MYDSIVIMGKLQTHFRPLTDHAYGMPIFQ